MPDQRRPPVLITDIISQASSQLREAGIDTPEHDAKLLLAEATGVELRDVDRAMLMGECVGTSEQLADFRAMLDRRAKREPLQYIVGHAPFRYLDLKVGPGVFIPRPETETVVQAGMDWLTANGLDHPRVVDLCAGSGAIGLSVATELPGSRVWAVELSRDTAQWTRRNLMEAARSHPSIASNYQLEIADATALTTLAHLDGAIDIVISNPPYVPLTQVPQQPEVRDHDPELALYGGSADGTLIPERIITRARRLLRPGGVLIMEHDVSQGDRLVSFAAHAGFTGAYTGKDWTGRDRYLFAVASADARGAV